MYGMAPILFHALLRIPVPCLLADVNHLADVVGVVRADVRDGRRPLGKLRFVCSLDRLLPLGAHGVEVLLRLRPLRGVEAVERLVVVAAELRRRLALELRELLAIPEDEVRGELADGVVALA